MSKAQIQIALIALGAYAVCAIIQQKVFAVPVIGGFLPR